MELRFSQAVRLQITDKRIAHDFRATEERASLFQIASGFLGNLRRRQPTGLGTVDNVQIEIIQLRRSCLNLSQMGRTVATANAVEEIDLGMLRRQFAQPGEKRRDANAPCNPDLRTLVLAQPEMAKG